MTAENTPSAPEPPAGEATITTELVGYEVEASDGHIGKVDEATFQVGAGYLVVDTGPWIFGRKVLLPAATISRVDAQARQVFINRTKQEIKSSPGFDKTQFAEPSYQDDVEQYYGRTLGHLPSGPPN